MKISIDIVERSFRDHVVKRHILDQSQASLSKCGFYDPLETVEQDTIYLCKDWEQLATEQLPFNSCFIFVDRTPSLAPEKMEHINYLVIAGIPVYKLFNQLLETFYKYEQYDKRFTALIQQKRPYQDLIDLGTEMVEMPLCMINLNYQTIALSDVDVADDSLWAAMQNGYGIGYFDFIQRCEFKTEEMSEKGITQKCSWSDVAGNYLCVNLLYLNGRPVGSIGMHKWYEKKKPFEKATMHLFNYLVARVDERIQNMHDIPESRYAPTDMLLIELLDGKHVNQVDIGPMLKRIGLPEIGPFHLAVFSPKQPLCRTEQLLDYMEMIERLQPNIHCCIYNATIVGLHVTRTKKDVFATKGLLDFMRSINYYCIYSLEFEDLMETRNSYKTLEILKRDVLTKNDLQSVCYAQDYLMEYALTVLSKYMDITKMVHPALKKLIEDDKHSKCDLYNVLRTYLYNKCSLKATSDALFLHRNTLASRISNIKEIIGINFEDEKTYKQMLFSIFCMDYCTHNLPSSSSNLVEPAERPERAAAAPPPPPPLSRPRETFLHYAY